MLQDGRYGHECISSAGSSEASETWNTFCITGVQTSVQVFLTNNNVISLFCNFEGFSISLSNDKHYQQHNME